VLTTKVPIRERDGRITAVFGVSRDITENKRLQAERAEMDRRINQSQKLESLGALAGGVAHDFNNILTIILNNATLAKGHAHDPVLFDECLGQIEHAAARAAHLCNQMLAYSGRGQFVIQPIRLADLVDDTLPLLRSGVSRKAQLEVVAEPCDAVAQADVTQIRQIILNLVINASDALGDSPGSIRIRTGLMRADADYLRATTLSPDLEPGAGEFVFLEVADTGCGMSAETVAKIFEPFFTTKFAGRGLGLAAVLGIVRGHHGAIRVDSQPGRGTTFRLLLPAVHGVAPRPLVRPVEAIVPVKVAGKILVVDDEEFIRSVLCRSLGKVGFETVSAASGSEAIALLAENPSAIAAVLLDLTMPRMDGQQTFEELRKIHPTLPVLLMRGFAAAISRRSPQFAAAGLLASFASGSIVSGSRRGSSMIPPLLSFSSWAAWSGCPLRISSFWPTTSTTTLSGWSRSLATRCTVARSTASIWPRHFFQKSGCFAKRPVNSSRANSPATLPFVLKFSGNVSMNERLAVFSSSSDTGCSVIFFISSSTMLAA
jgi:signal transduction histidine kinase/CheY-like chemotaxis protein